MVVSAAAETIAARIDQLQRLVDDASDDRVLRDDLAAWAGRTRSPAHAELFGDALALADLMGRASVLDEAAADGDIELSEPTLGTVTFDEALSFFRQKVSMPSDQWTSHLRDAHDRSFVVAGADDMALVEDIRLALDRAMDGGGGFAAFKRDFRDIVERTGWAHNGSLGRRARTIYETNLKNARAAGRWAQMRDPEMMRLRPYWRYVHGDLREPLVPREEHEALDGLVLRADDPIWLKIYPPNGWWCSCGVRALSEAGLRRLGKDGPDEAPALKTRKVLDPATDERVDVPEGIDLGWDYAPGASWHGQVVPRELQTPLLLDPDLPRPDSLPPIEELSKPLTSEVLGPDLTEEEYMTAFLSRFGASVGTQGGAVWRDVTGTAVPISDDLFRRANGSLKALKRGRAPYMARMAEAMMDPDEVWLQWAFSAKGPPRLFRLYLRYDAEASAVLVHNWGRGAWQGSTTYTTDGPTPRDRIAHIEAQRQGALLYRRPSR